MLLMWTNWCSSLIQQHLLLDVLINVQRHLVPNNLNFHLNRRHFLILSLDISLSLLYEWTLWSLYAIGEFILIYMRSSFLRNCFFYLKDLSDRCHELNNRLLEKVLCILLLLFFGAHECRIRHRYYNHLWVFIFGTYNALQFVLDQLIIRPIYVFKWL